MSSSRRVPLLVLGLVLLGLLGLPTGANAAAGVTSPRAASLTTAQFESQLLTLTNARRKKVGCSVFRSKASLVSAARTHTLKMVRTGQFQHQVSRESGLGKRISRAGYTRWRALAENIAWGQGVTPAAVFSMWLHSKPHRTNIQNCRLHDIGYGVRFSGKSVWVTSDFGRR